MRRTRIAALVHTLGTVRLLISVLAIAAVALAVTSSVVGLVQRRLISADQRQSILRVESNQQRTISTLRDLHRAERTYFAATRCFASLPELRVANLIDDALADGIKDGYMLIEEHTCERVVIFAVPLSDTGVDRTGDFWYAMTTDGHILAQPARDMPRLDAEPYEVQQQ